MLRDKITTLLHYLTFKAFFMKQIKTTIPSVFMKTKNLQLALGTVICLTFFNELNAQTSYSANAIPISGTGCVGIGSFSLASNTSGGYNTAAGFYALNANVSTNYNSAFGYQSLYGTKATGNTGMGFRTLYNNTTGAENTALGYTALYSNNSSGIVGIGAYALYSNSSGTKNVATGYKALYSNTTGNDNTADGYQALYSNTTGWNNEAYGSQALYSNTIGAYNTAYGSRALYANVINNRSCAFGFESLTASTGDHNTAMGFRSLNTNTTGSQNTAFGENALGNNTTGSSNTGLGIWANVSTGNLSNATAVGYTAVSNASNKVRIGNASVTVIEGAVMFTGSDGRFKTNIKEEDVKGLEFIKKLRPVVYNLDTKRLTELWTKNMPEDVRKQYLNQDFTASTNIRQSGFIAQEVEKAAKDVNYDFNGVHAPENETDNYSLAYSQFVVPLVKAVQEQQKMIEELKQQINDLQKGGTTGIGNALSIEGASMEQNVPNPFSHETVIAFNLPQQISNAYMTVYDLSGREIKTLPIAQRGKSSIAITSEQLEAGMYIYSIVADGKLIDSKRMVVSK